MKATDVFVQCLEAEGVEYIFGIVGTETLDLVHSLSHSKQLQFVNVRHEQGAAFMADVYGRLSGKPGVCLATLGPGATNLLTGIASSNLDHSPVVALMGQAPFERQHKDSHQFVDLVKIFEPVTKWSIQIKDAQTIPEVIRKSFKTASMEKPGPVAIVLPENLATQMITSKPLPITPLPVNIPIQESIESARALINQHKRPFVIIGNGVLRQGATDELKAFLERLQSPVIHSYMAKGVLPKDHPLNFFTFGFNEADKAVSSIQEADLLIVIGFDFVEKLPKEWNKKRIPVLHIDTLPAEVDEYYLVEIELVGDVKQILRSLHTLDIPAKPWVPAGDIREQTKQSYHIKDKQKETNDLPLTIEHVLHSIEALSLEKTIVLSDVGAHKVSIARTYQPKQPNGLIISNGLASMGIALPGSIGAKLACPDAQVICITGDGGALMNIAEIETAKRLGLSFIILVLNDGMLKIEEQMMDKKFGASYGVTFQNPDFVQLATSFGIKGRRAKHIAEFESILKEALECSGEIVLIDVVIQN